MQTITISAENLIKISCGWKYLREGTCFIIFVVLYKINHRLWLLLW